jgi:hypothetical protein
MIYTHKFYVNGFGFDDYEEAKRYADFLVNWKRTYKCVFTRDEMNAMHQEDAEALNDFREHFNK